MKYEHIENLIFKALADPNRRLLLDILFDTDGLTLNSLCTHLDMSRIGVMKHLKILEEAGVITTRKVGREKLHYLNPVPIHQIHNRWVSKFAEPWVSGLASFKNSLERDFTVGEKPKHVYQILIKTNREQLWNALTDPKMTSQFWYNCYIYSDWKEGSTYTLTNETGDVQAQGYVLECVPLNRLVVTWEWFVFEETSQEKASRITWEIEEHPNLTDVCVLSVVHDQFGGAPNTYRIIESGWPTVLSGLKTLLETGEPLGR
ncbi:metalloregulator ArsR/SmtB family transcription factor [Halalkalibacter sp. APA_J-10(15)]|uniref:ArsR/SmtB family transcription factor n=1 Tax=unclassified Halalkalibacter TaxID=2893063 RepID=UPI001FF398A0|nr:metalloregulator ArsR/SmtB family transcription factor [Halalkalibacter sp. APA_J-10(15)]MCK0473734.1 metalloregulator ArsR/SmtB family transcription factor [Halalkalibacter sp. APA_J-10(15)]